MIQKVTRYEKIGTKIILPTGELAEILAKEKDRYIIHILSTSITTFIRFKHLNKCRKSKTSIS